MNDFSIHSLAPDELDELLSAHLDGELDAACADLGYDVGTVRNAIESSPVAAARVAILGRAITALETDGAVELDEISRRRLVKATMGHVPAQRTGGLSWGTAAAGLVAVAAFAGAIFVASRSDTAADKTASSPQTQTTRNIGGQAGSTADEGSERGVQTTGNPLAGIESVNDLEDLGTIYSVEDLGKRLASQPSQTEAWTGLHKSAYAKMKQTCVSHLDAADSNGIRFVARGVYKGEAVLVAEVVSAGKSQRWIVQQNTCQILLTIVP